MQLRSRHGQRPSAPTAVGKTLPSSPVEPLVPVQSSEPPTARNCTSVSTAADRAIAQPAGFAFLSAKCGRAIRGHTMFELQVMRMLEVCDEVSSFSMAAHRDHPEATVAIQPFLPAITIQWRSGDTWLAWLAAMNETQATRSQTEFEAAAVAAVVSGVHFVVVTHRHLALVDHGDVECASDIKRRWRAGLVDAQIVTQDDLIVETVERQIRRMFAAVLDDAPSTEVCRRLGLPIYEEAKAAIYSHGVRDDVGASCGWRSARTGRPA